MEEATALSAGWAELIFGIDNLHRGTAYIALRRRGHSAESARRALREKSAEYGQEASSPIQDLARAFVWYSVFTFQTAQQLAKLAAQRPGVAAAIVEGWRDVPQYQGLDREETEISRATFLGPEWVRVKMSSPVFPDDIKPDPRGVMVQEDGPYFVYMRVRFPVVETAGQVMEMVREPVQSFLRQAPPTMSIPAQMEQRGKNYDPLRAIPLIGGYVSRMRRVPGEALFAGAAGFEVSPEVLQRVIDAEGAHEAAVLINDEYPGDLRNAAWGNFSRTRQVPESVQARRVLWRDDPEQAAQLELERMRFYTKLHVASSRTGMSFFAQPVRDLFHNMTLAELKRARADAERKLAQGEHPIITLEMYDSEIEKRRLGIGDRSWMERAGGLLEKAARRVSPPPWKPEEGSTP